MKRIISTLCRLAIITVPILWAGLPPASAEEKESFSTLLNQAATNREFTAEQDLVPLFLAAREDLDQARVSVLSQQAQEPRSDLQHGADAGASGTTTLAEKPGLSEFLNLAIERGAIIKTTSGDSFTLQTTPYLFYSHFGGEDTARKWEQLTFLRKISISTTFKVSGQENDTGLENLEGGELKWAVLGNRSIRDKRFRDQVRSILVNEIGSAMARTTLDANQWTNKLPPGVDDEYSHAVIEFANWRDNTPKPIAEEDIIAELHRLFDPIYLKLRPEDIGRLKALVESLSKEEEVEKNTFDVVKVRAKEYLERGQQLSLAYSLHRDPMLSDFSSLKVLYGYETGAILSANLNGELTFNNDRSALDGTQLDRVRAYSVEGGLTLGKFANDAADFTASAKFMRPKGESQDMRSVQAKLNLYLIRGATIPIALTYSNRTEDSNRSRLRVNVGFSLNGDAFLGVARRNP